MDNTASFKPGKLPAGIPYIMSNEIAERFSYYGMTAILNTFLVRRFFNPTGDVSLDTLANAKSNYLVHLFFSLIYFLPIFDGILADWFLGKYKTILYLSLVYCLGHFLLFVFSDNMKITIMAFLLLCISIGNFILCLISGSIASNGFFSFLHGASYYLFFSIIMIAATLFYYFIIKRNLETK